MPRKSQLSPSPSPSPSKVTKPTKLSEGAGMTAGLELWQYGAKIALYDRSPDNRFATDVATWNSALSLKPADIDYSKNATQ